ncbi:putative phosphoinositide phospholipase C [Helianthus annuus]|nr:putative phosphoinositide phospholipase C [Helianthus annuus]
MLANPKKGLKDALKVEKDKVRRLSLAEQALEKAAENYGQDVVRYSRIIYFYLQVEILTHLHMDGNFEPFRLVGMGAGLARLGPAPDPHTAPWSGFHQHRPPTAGWAEPHSKNPTVIKRLV